MKVLVTGATGLVGKQLIGQLIQNNIEVHYLTTSLLKVNDISNAKGFFWNINDKIINSEAFRGVSVVINLTGATISKRWTKAYKQEILTSRINSLQLLFEAIKENNFPIRHLISASAVGIYRDSESKLHHENSRDFNSGFLGEVVPNWENSAMQFNTLNCEVSIIRIGLVLTKKEGVLYKMLQPIKMGFGSALGSGNQWQSWIHIHDLISIFIFVLNNNLHGVYNAVAPFPVTNKHLTKTIAQVVEKKIWLPNVPEFILKLMLGEMSQIVLQSQKVSSKKIIDEGFQFQYISLEKALQDLLVE